jgi:hypothetical protein
VALDSSGHAIVVGSTDSSNFPTENAFQDRRMGSFADVFVTAVESDRSGYLYSTYLGARSSEGADAIAVGCDGAAYVTGYVAGSGFPVENALQPRPSDVYDAFVITFAPDGQSLVYRAYLGGKSSDHAFGIALADDESVVITGSTQSMDFPVANAFQDRLKGQIDAFLTVLSADGASLSFSTYLGGPRSAYEHGHDVAIDVDGSIHVTGWTDSPEFPVEEPVQHRLRGDRDAFVSTLSKDGQSLLHSTLFGGVRLDRAYGIAAVGDGSVVFAGHTESPDFPETSGFQPDYGGLRDAFVVHLEALKGIGTAIPPVPSATTTSTPSGSATQTPDVTHTATSGTPPTGTTTPSATPTGLGTSTPTATVTPTDEKEFTVFVPFAELP